MRHAFFLSVLLFCIAPSLGCTPQPSDVCDPKCECEGCSSREYDECVDDYLDDERRAADRRCLPEFDEYQACQEETWTCRGDDFDTDCGRERSRLSDCLD